MLIFIVYTMKSYMDGDFPKIVGAYYSIEQAQEVMNSSKYEYHMEQTYLE